VGGNSYNNVNSALTAVNTTASEGWNLSANGGTAANVAPGATVNVSQGSSGNITVSRSGTALTIDTSATPSFTSVTSGNTLMNTGGLTISGGTNGTVSLSNAGLNNGGNVITGVAAGAVTASSTQAINGSQLYTVDTSLNNLGGSVASGLGGSSSYNSSTGAVTTSLSVGGNSYNNVNSALTAVNTTASEGWNLSANGGTAANVAPGATVNVSQGSSGNIAVTQSGTDLTIDTNPNLTATSLTTGDTLMNTSGVTISGGTNGTVSLTDFGLDNGDNVITGVAAGAVTPMSLDAINGSQLYATDLLIGTLGGSVASGMGGNSTYNSGTGQVTTSLSVGGNTYNNVNSALNAVNQTASEGWNLAANGGAAANVAPGATVDVSGGSSGNITVSQSGTNLTIDTSPNLTETSVTTGNTVTNSSGVTISGGNNGAVSLTNTGLNNGGNQITGVADGAVTSTSTDAVNGSQLYAITQMAGSGWDLSVNGDTATTVAPGSTVTLQQGTNIAIARGSDPNVVTIATSPDLTADSLTINNGGPSLSSSGINMNDTKVTNLAAGTNPGDAVNLSQLPIQYSTPNGTPTPANPTTNDVTLVGPVVIQNASSGAYVSAPVTIHNVAAGVAPTDAANVGQLPGAWQSSSSNTFVFNNANASSSQPVTLTNVAPGGLSAFSTDAVNGSQLYATNQSINNLASFTTQGFAQLQQQARTNRLISSSGIASAMALGMMRFDDRPGKLSVGLGTGTYDGQVGISLGAGFTSQNDLWRFSAGATYSPTNSHAGVGAGASVTYTLN
jgi:autotransporter adhesin